MYERPETSSCRAGRRVNGDDRKMMLLTGPVGGRHDEQSHNEDGRGWKTAVGAAVLSVKRLKWQ